MYTRALQNTFENYCNYNLILDVFALWDLFKKALLSTPKSITATVCGKDLNPFSVRMKEVQSIFPLRKWFNQKEKPNLFEKKWFVLLWDPFYTPCNSTTSKSILFCVLSVPVWKSYIFGLLVSLHIRVAGLIEVLLVGFTIQYCKYSDLKKCLEYQ